MMLDIVGSSYELAQKSLSSQRTINWVVEHLTNAGAKSKTVLMPTPGAEIKLEVMTDFEDCRGLFYSSTGPNGMPRLYGVWGYTVFRFAESLNGVYPIGSISSGATPVRMMDNGFRFVVADGINLWEYPLNAEDGDANTLISSGLPPIAGLTPVENVSPTHVAFLGQRLLINSQSTNQWYFSGLPKQDTPLEWGAADFYTMATSANNILAVASCNGSLWIFGYKAVEIWRTNDNQYDPYSYSAGSQSSIGIVAAQSVATVNNMIFWLGGSEVGAAGVYMGQGTSMNRISDMAIEDQIMSLADQTDALGWAYSHKSMVYYVLSFPNSNRTFVYEVTTNTWTERLLRDIESGEWLVYPYQFGIVVRGEIYTGLIGAHPSYLIRLSEDLFTEFDGRQVVRQRTAQPIFDSLDKIQTRELAVDMEVGVTPLLSGYGSDPKLQLEVSNDAGYTYGSVKTMSTGKQGAYRTYVRRRIPNLGRSFVFRLTTSYPGPCAIYQARLDYQPCSNT
jgi:hypothetical protein